MTLNSPIFIGIDIGTQGVRAMALDHKGRRWSQAKKEFDTSLISSRNEQSPWTWREAVLETLRMIQKDLRKEGLLNKIQALSVTSTSGTVIPLDQQYQPIHNALMYCDHRAVEETEICRQAAESIPEIKSQINVSWSLPKIVWYIRNFPDKLEQVKCWCHAGDYIIGVLSGTWEITDYSNALKSGFNLEKVEWPDFILTKLSIPRDWLPRVRKPGEIVGRLRKEIAEETGLPSDIPIVLGMTDGCTGQIAAGCTSIGDWNTTIGTTMVIKGITRKKIVDKYGVIYNHKHPMGYWMPGGASNTGADWVAKDFKSYDLNQLSQRAEQLTPTKWIAYPLQQTGERFPFLCQEAKGFEPEGLKPEEIFTARMEGLAYLERLAYEYIENSSKEKVRKVFTAGGASSNQVWLKIRSSILQRPVLKMKHTESAAGAAIIAASQTFYNHLAEASQNMTLVEIVIEPERRFKNYEDHYFCFVEKLGQLGYLKE